MKFLRQFLLATTLLLPLMAQAEKTPAQIEAEKRAEEAKQLGPLPMDLGILGAAGNIQVKHKEIVITAIQNAGLLSAAGLKLGDKVIGANGKEFEELTNEPLDGGKGPQEGLGYAIQNCLKSKSPLELSILRGSQMLKLKITIPALRPFSKTYPENCPRSDIMLDAFCQYLRDTAGPDVVWGHRWVTSTACGLCLLANGDKKDSSLLKKLAQRFCSEFSDFKSQGFHSWNVVYTGTYLCEYYLATGDTSVLPTIKLICDDLVKRVNEKGRSGHGYEVGYDGDGINIITTHILLVWSLAGKCGVPCDTAAFERAYKHCVFCQVENGGDAGAIGYGKGSNSWDACARTGLFALAMGISGKDKDKGQFAATYIENCTKRVRENHTNCAMGFLWAPATLSMHKPKAYRSFMDYWSWFYELCNRADKDAMPVWYIGSKRNNGGDEYLNKELYFIGCIGSSLALSKHNLFIHGNTKRGWFLGKRSGGLIAAYRISCKSSSELLDAVADKVDDLSAPEELKEALTFSRDAARISEKGKKFRAELLQQVRLRASKLTALSALRPIYAQGRLKNLMDLSLSDPELGPEMKIQFKLAGGDPVKTASSTMMLYAEAGSLLSDDKKLSNSAQISRIKTFVLKVDSLQKASKASPEERLELEALREWADQKIHGLIAQNTPS